MARSVTLCSGQWADIPINELLPMVKEMGYDGIELACWGDHFEVDRAVSEEDYCDNLRALLKENGLECYSVSNHLAGQLVCDLNDDARSDAFAPEDCAGNPEKKRAWAIEAMKNTARAAQRFGVSVVNGFTGSSIWHMVYSFPPASQEMIDAGFKDFADRWNPIMDVFDECGVKFALEVHPTEIAFDIHSARLALDAIDNREAFGFNFDPSHLIWQGMEPHLMINEFPNRIYHVHMKDTGLTLDGKTGLLGGHVEFGDARRGWEFRSVGRGDVNFEEIIRSLNRIQYTGPLSVEWEDMGMDRVHGATESCEYTKSIDFKTSDVVFDAAFDKDNQ
jgi:sugar phosphate isomerase/epimerase